MKQGKVKESESISKKHIREAISNQLLSAMPSLKDQIGKKKYQNRIKKAAKLLLDGIKIIPKKETIVRVKKATKTVAAKTAN